MGLGFRGLGSHLQTTLMSLPLVSTATMLPLRKPDSNVCAWEGHCHQGRRAVRL